VGGLKDFLVDGRNALLFDDNDIASLKKAYDRLPALRSTLIAEGQKTARQYNWQTIAENLTGIYKELL
jgi:glycosyltransferase involved in cell wall biosynthesis